MEVGGSEIGTVGRVRENKFKLLGSAGKAMASVFRGMKQSC
jgi:hypothetical protein